MPNARKLMQSTTVWAAALCVVGGLSSVALPWKIGGIPIPGGSLIHAAVFGIETWHGGAIGAVYLLLLLYLIATSPVEPIPLWRPLGTLVFATIAVGLFHDYGYGPGMGWHFYPGPWLTALATLGVLIVGTLELRAAFARRSQT